MIDNAGKSIRLANMIKEEIKELERKKIVIKNPLKLSPGKFSMAHRIAKHLAEKAMTQLADYKISRKVANLLAEKALQSLKERNEEQNQSSPKLIDSKQG